MFGGTFFLTALLSVILKCVDVSLALHITTLSNGQNVIKRMCSQSFCQIQYLHLITWIISEIKISYNLRRPLPGEKGE